MEFSIGENTKVSELLRSDDYIDRGHPKVKPKKKLTHTEKKPKSVIETKVKMKGVTIKEILLSKVRDAVPKGTIVERLMYESKIRTEEDIAKDLDENFIPHVSTFTIAQILIVIHVLIDLVLKPSKLVEPFWTLIAIA